MSAYNVQRDDVILVVIPYFAGGAQGRELECAVAGWRKHFKENYHIVIVGDYNRIADSGKDISFIQCPRVIQYGRWNYRPHIDHVRKFRRLREHYPDSKGFIYSCDDIYAFRDFTIDDVLVPKVKRMEIAASLEHMNGWVRDNARTKNILMKMNLPYMDWVCHLPVYYEWDKLLAIYDKYRCDTTSYVVENLYFNEYYPNIEPVLLDEESDDIQYKLWNKESSIEDFRKAIGTKTWIANSVRGYRPEMEVILREYYGLQ